MREFAVLWRRELREMLRSRAFIATLAIGVLLMVALSLLPSALSYLRRASTTTVAVADPTGWIEPALAATLAHTGAPVRLVPLATNAASAQYLDGLLRTHRIQAYLLVRPGPDGASDASFTLGTRTASPQTALTLKAALQQALVPLRLRQAGIDPGAVAPAFVPPAFTVRVLGGGATARSPTVATAMVYFLIVFLFISILMNAQMMLMGVTTEKTSRVSEVLLVTTTPERLLAGKVAGVGTAGLIQVGALACAGGVMYAADPGLRHLATGAGLQLGQLPFFSLPLFVAFFVVGFFEYGALYAALGAAAGRPEEAASASALPSLVMVVAYGLAILGLAIPDSRLIAVASFVPPLTPWLMFERLVLTHVPWWQWALALLLCVGCIAVVLRWSAAIYRRNLLRDGAFSWSAVFGRG